MFLLLRSSEELKHTGTTVLWGPRGASTPQHPSLLGSASPPAPAPPSPTAALPRVITGGKKSGMKNQEVSHTPKAESSRAESTGMWNPPGRLVTV